jgi:rhamnosyltransferase
MQGRADSRTAMDATPDALRGHAERLASVAAVVVLFHPQPAVLARLIESIASQVNKIFIVDNTPSRTEELPAPVRDCGCSVRYHANGANKGLAGAQNTGIAYALDENYTHVLLLDQDSALSGGAVDGLLAAERSLLSGGIPVAAVGPLFIDEKTGERSRAVHRRYFRVDWVTIPPEETKPVEADYLIASGSLIRSSVLRQVGLMRDVLFIDWVDTEWAYRAQSYGYKTYIIPTVVMRHNIGDATVQFMGKRFNLHSPARNYYIVRNAVYLLRDSRMSWIWRLSMLAYIPKYILVHGWLSQHRWRSARQMLRAVWEGLAGTMRPFAAP